ncbi:S26 family signal peptidase [Nonomuraea sp. NPDC049400]|uniref:S26 family signal peptidase n=1 Tax=Nonomuraea sp. NPDC049400 TaxID=3364352 RepID=UPI0037AEE61C
MNAVVLTATAVAAVLVGGYCWVRSRYLAIAIHGTSMIPALQDGDRILVRRGAVEKVRRGDVVVFAVTTGLMLSMDAPPPTSKAGVPDFLPSAPRLMAKRAVAIPGDTIPKEVVHACGNADVVPPGKIVVLGENPSASTDSRHYGFVSAEEVVGVAIRKYVPLHHAA